jgi:hypothetical protein
MVGVDSQKSKDVINLQHSQKSKDVIDLQHTQTTKLPLSLGNIKWVLLL